MALRSVSCFLLLSCMVATMGGVIFGYEVAITGVVSSMDQFLNKFYPSVMIKMKESPEFRNYCKFDSQKLIAFKSSMYISGIFASVIAAHLTERRGHKLTMIIGGCSSIVGAALGGGAFNIWMLIMARILVGVGLGFTNQAVPLYLCEMAPTRHRGAFGVAFRLGHVIGFLLAILVSLFFRKIEGNDSWSLSLLLSIIPAFVLAFGPLFLPEPPIDFVRRGGVNMAKTEATLRKMRGSTDQVLYEAEEIIYTAGSLRISSTVGETFRKIAQTKYGPHLVTAVGIAVFTGLNPVAFYDPGFLLKITDRPGERLLMVAAVVPGAIAILVNVIAMFTVDRLGRRTLFMIGAALMVPSLVVTSGVLAEEGPAYLVLILICIHVAGFEFSWGPLGWSCPAEILPLGVRSVGQSVIVVVNFLCAFAMAHIFGGLLCVLKSGTFVFFGMGVAAMTGFVYAFLPELKNVAIRRMERVWGEHWYWRRMLDIDQHY